MSGVKSKPDGYNTVTPYLIVRGAKEALDFYKKALGAEEVLRLEMPNGVIGHAELQVGDSRIMMADEHPEMGAKSPQAFGGTPVSLMIYVDDVDSYSERAVTAGMKVERPVKDQFYGDRSGSFVDPYGHHWTFATHKEDLTDEEVKKRAAELFAN